MHSRKKKGCHSHAKRLGTKFNRDTLYRQQHRNKQGTLIGILEMGIELTKDVANKMGWESCTAYKVAYKCWGWSTIQIRYSIHTNTAHKNDQHYGNGHRMRNGYWEKNNQRNLVQLILINIYDQYKVAMSMWWLAKKKTASKVVFFSQKCLSLNIVALAVCSVAYITLLLHVSEYLKGSW